jgi:hypothetical protein
MRIAFGWLALLLFCVSMVVHVAAVLGVDVQDRVPLVWLLHVGVFVVAVPMILAMRKWKSGSFSSLLRGLPIWARAFTISLLAYVVLNFISFMASAADGQPAERDHRYLLEDRGKFVRELTAEEYHSRCARTVRGFSGHWLAFYFLSFAVLVLHEETLGTRDPRRRTIHVRPE